MRTKITNFVVRAFIIAVILFSYVWISVRGVQFLVQNPRESLRLAIFGCCGFFIIMFLIGFALQISMMRNYEPSITFPGIEAKKKFSTVSKTGVELRVAAKIKPLETIDVSFITDGTHSEPLGLAHWRLHLYLTIFNRGNHNIVVNDMHAHVFCRETRIVPLASIANREWIEIYQTNSILEGGKAYEIQPKDYLPVEIVLEITRLQAVGDSEGSPVSGMVLSIFGLYLDYHLIKNEDIIRIRIPSDSIFSFQDEGQGHLVYVNNTNISDYWEKHKESRGGRTLVNTFREALEKHTSYISELKTKDNLSGTDLREERLYETDLSGANLKGADLRGADLEGANLSKADLREVDLSHAKLDKANLCESDIRGGRLIEAKLSRAILNGANLTKADLSRAYLSNTELVGVILKDADLSEAYLNEANLSEADLSGANLQEAHLKQANLYRANLKHTDLSKAQLQSVNLRDGKYNSSTIWPEGFAPQTAGAILED